MKKRFLAFLLAAAAVLSAAGMPVYAEKYFGYVNSVAGIEFNSFDKLAEYADTLYGASSVKNVDSAVSDFLLSAEGIYLPEDVEADDVQSILITPIYCCARFEYDDTDMELSCYHTSKAGKGQLDIAKSYYKDDALPCGKSTRKGNIIYYYELPLAGDYESRYLWKQDGKYFELRVYDGLDGSHLSLCNAVMNYFEDNYSYSGKNGSAIKTARQLMNMKADGKYYLANDIDLSDTDWKGIKNFSGSFDGNGHKIIGLYSEGDGLFASLKTGASIKNVILYDVYIASENKAVGAVVSVIPDGQKNIVIDNCFVEGVVASCRTKHGLKASSSTAGAIAGENNSAAVISNCYSNAVVASENTVGGIAGVNYGTIKNCGFGGQLGNSYNIYRLVLNEGGAVDDEYRYLYAEGGISGYNYGDITNCFSNCTRFESASYYGGIAGRHQKGHISYCVNSSYVPFDYDTAGGHIAGYAGAQAKISNCYSRKATAETVKNDVGKGNTKSVTYVVPESRYGRITSFKRLGSDWVISADGVPVLKKLRTYTHWEPQWLIVGGDLENNELEEI